MEEPKRVIPIELNKIDMAHECLACLLAIKDLLSAEDDLCSVDRDHLASLLGHFTYHLKDALDYQ